MAPSITDTHLDHHILSNEYAVSSKTRLSAMARATLATRPRFNQLPLQPDHPKASAWGVWGADDERGTLNLLSEEVTRNASTEIILGKAINLNLPMNVPQKPMNPRRKKCSHIIHAKGYANDDELDINTQSSSHWDGLRHYPYQSSLQYYNGVTQEDISGDNANTKIGIQNIALKPIVTRGVLLDWYSYAKREGHPIIPFKNTAIPLSHLQAIAQESNITFRQGDVLLIRTGWTAEYYKLSEAEKEHLGGRDDRASCGVEATEESIQWHWDNGFAAVASDTVAYEAWPSPKAWGVSMHEVFLSGWGMPIGEQWDLEELSRVCREQGRWTFLLTSQPLVVPGGVASPANATAIF